MVGAVGKEKAPCSINGKDTCARFGAHLNDTPATNEKSGTWRDLIGAGQASVICDMLHYSFQSHT